VPDLACRICGRIVYTTASLDSLFAEERRCPRCGGMLGPDRRRIDRRAMERRRNSPRTPGPPNGPERRRGEQRTKRRRRDQGKPPGVP
jgi:hypothetical protein